MSDAKDTPQIAQTDIDEVNFNFKMVNGKLTSFVKISASLAKAMNESAKNPLAIFVKNFLTMTQKLKGERK